MTIPHFISIGHMTHDLVGNGITPGGPALYSTCTARNLGIPVGMITSFSRPLLQPGLLQGIDIRCQESQKTTTFANLYNEHGERRQIIESVADRITPALIPPAWRSVPIVNICPVANEYTSEIVRLFDNALIGICPQGWMRKWDHNGQVMRKPWENFREVLPYADLVFFSEEDVADPIKAVEMYLPYTKMVVVTHGKRGASIYSHDGVYHSPAFPTVEVDPTGAGDVFATAFLVRYAETRDVSESAKFANCAASFVVEKEGIYGISRLDDVQRRLRAAR